MDERNIVMLENIMRIGLFMIAAQAVIHFSPGRQYEKYIKLISSVIVLFLFVRPFLSLPDEADGAWQQKAEQILEEYEKENLWQADADGFYEKTVKQLEEEVKSRLNERISESGYCVDLVSLVFEGDISGAGDEKDGPALRRVEIVMDKKGVKTVEPIQVEGIVIGDEKEEENTKAASQFQEAFAGILGIEPRKVEVTCVGGW